MRILGSDTVTRIRPTRVASAHGGTRLDWTTPDELPVTECRLQVRTSDEAGGRDTLTHRLYAPVAADIDADDHIRATEPGTGRAITAAVIGRPLRRISRTGHLGYAEVELREVDTHG